MLRPLPLLSLAACAPVATLPPPTPLAEARPTEVGAAFDFAAIDPDQSDTCDPDGSSGFLEIGTPCLGPGLDAWVRHEVGRVEIGGLLYLSTTAAAGGGMTLRVLATDTDTLRLGVQAEVGGFWVAGGVPIAARAGDLWLTTAPSFGWRANAPLRLPVGVGIPAGESAMFAFELSAGWGYVANGGAPRFESARPALVAGALTLGFRPE